MKKIVNGLRILSVVTFWVAFYLIFSNVNSDVWQVDSALNMGQMILILIWLLSAGIGILVGSGDPNSPIAQTVYGAIWHGIFGQSAVANNPLDLISQLFQSETPDVTATGLFIGSIVSLVLFIVVPVAIMASIGFLRNCDTKLATISFVCLQMVLIVGFLTDSYIDTLNDVLIQDYSSASILELLQSSLFQTGLVTYLYLELSLSAAYSYRIIEPLAGRRRRIVSHIRHVREYVPAREETPTSTIESMPTSTRGGRFSMEAMTYLRESLERRIFKRKDADYSVNQRLKTYFETLIEQNPDAERTLTAESVSPKASRIALAIAPNLLIRMVVVIVVAWTVLNPSQILTRFIILPDNARPLLQSLELTQPEMLLSILAPICIGFVLLGFILSWVRDKWFVERDEISEVESPPLVEESS